MRARFKISVGPRAVSYFFFGVFLVGTSGAGLVAMSLPGLVESAQVMGRKVSAGCISMICIGPLFLLFCNYWINSFFVERVSAESGELGNAGEKPRGHASGYRFPDPQQSLIPVMEQLVALGNFIK